MNKKIWGITFGVFLVSCVVIVFLTTMKQRTFKFTLTSYKGDILDLGEFEGKVFRESKVIFDLRLTFAVTDEESFKLKIREADSFLADVSKEDYYIFKVNDSFFYV